MFYNFKFLKKKNIFRNNKNYKLRLNKRKMILGLNRMIVRGYIKINSKRKKRALQMLLLILIIYRILK